MLMSTRLQVVMDEEDLARCRRCAEREGKTLSVWVREVLRHALRARGGPSPDHRLAALDRALECGHPTGDLDELLAEIEAGRDLR